MADKNTIKNWFRTNLKPTQSQFWATWDSFWHKDEKIPITAIDDIENILADKADADALSNHTSDENAHADLFAAVKISGRFLINRNNLMFFADEPITGDTVTGMVENEYLNAGTFYGGNFELLSSYEEIIIVGQILEFNPNASIYGDELIYTVNEEVASRVFTCAGYLVVNIKYKKPEDLEFNVYEIGGDLVNRQDYPFPVYVAYISYLELVPGTIVKLSDINGSFEDSDEFIIT